MALKTERSLESGEWERIKQEPEWNDSSQERAKKWFEDFLQSSAATKAETKQNPMRRTAYLDGLRGFAAFLVYWNHHQVWAHTPILSDRILESAYGYDKQYYFACLPGIRMFFSGGAIAVAVFFVISGYVLAAKPLSLIHAGSQIKLADNIASALSRRWLRLYLPIIGTTFLYMSSWYAFDIWTPTPETRQSNYRDELWNWYVEFKNFSFIFRTGDNIWMSYNMHVWSIPVEFRGSIIIYTTVLAFSRYSRNTRLWGQLGLIFYFMYIVDGWFGAAFVAGMLLCDLDLLARSNELPRFFYRLEPYKKVIYHVLFVVGILLGGCPSFTSDIERLRNSPGWGYLSYLKPQAVFDYKWFYLFWASVCLVASIPRIPALKSFFESRFCQYLGRISYSFYLVHGPVLWTLGDRLYVATGWAWEVHATNLPDWINILPLSKSGPLGLEPSFLIPQLILLPTTLYVAELTTKFIDEPSVKVSQWVYRKMLASSD